MGYIRGEGRDQGSLFPVCLDELVPEEHLVRVIEAYVARLDLHRLGFSKARASKVGRPAYDPADLLKLYLYGYFHRIRSSRRLEAECQRNVEVMWLLGQLVPDFKTIADFRKDNGVAFQATCRAFVQFCRQVGLIGGQLVAIDGSKFQAVASRRKHLSLARLKRQQARLEAEIARYLSDLDEADRAEAGEGIDRGAVKTALEQLQARHADNLTCQVLMQAQGLEQFVIGESDAQLMRTQQGARVAYNVQSAVDDKHCLVLHHEVTRDGNDTRQLQPMAEASQAVLAQAQLTVTADAGYSNGEQFHACEEAGITAYVPLNRGINNHGKGMELFDRSIFTYDAEHDRYQCPAGQWLLLKQVRGMERIYAISGDCCACPLQSRCTNSKRRHLTRHAHESAFERMQQRLKARPDMMAKRRSIVEHPFGNLKQWIFGNGRFLLRQLGGASTEMALAVQAYNLKRAIQVLGARRLIELMA
ncbi:IS1182 family transposase [Pseudomonas sp. RW407]|uniref:IS1182 family transposase n=2 Tax=Pseudomonas sp. RW407 TaxID=2202894 RepID=UPI000D6F94C6|nr:IS1182 family transposase [Pseudomonas sp. RW407]PWU30837.1 IS1182 family transposase [Pseudomonas sp. RW407]